MNLSSKAENIYARIREKGTQLQELRKIAKEIKKDHALAMELWSTEEFLPRMLAILIMDKNLLSQEIIDKLDKEMRAHPKEEQTRLMDWLLANQLVKNPKTIELLESWENSPSSLQRRAFWYYQSRLRWMGSPLRQILRTCLLK